MARSIHDDDLHHEEHDVLAEGLSRSTIASIVAAMIVLGSIAGVAVYFGTEGNVLSVQLFQPSRNADVLTFAYSITTDHGGASGIGQFTVVYNGSAVLNKTLAASSAGRIDVRFSEFVYGNGDYTFQLLYRGFAGNSIYTVGDEDHTEFIVTGIAVSSQLVYPDGGATGALGVRVDFFSNMSKNRYAAAPPGANISYRVLKNGITQDAAAIDRGVEGKTYVAFNYTPALRIGNYTIEVTYHNTWVVPNSDIGTIVERNTTFVHNKPVACTDQDTYRGTSGNSTITFNAGCSTDDGAIVQYTWDFGDGSPTVTSLSSPLETHTFPSTAPRSYVGTLTVKDNGPEGGQEGTKTFAIQITVF